MSEGHEHSWQHSAKHVHITRDARPMSEEEFRALARFGRVVACAELTCACGEVQPADCHDER